MTAWSVDWETRDMAKADGGFCEYSAVLVLSVKITGS